MKVEYAYDQDPRYGWASITIERGTDNLIVIHSEDGSHGFKYHKGEMVPTCTCHAWHSSECCCLNVDWSGEDDYIYD